MKLLSLVFLSLCLPLSAADRAALLICNHKYQHPDSFRPIPAAVADLTTMQKALGATGFAPGDIADYYDLKSAEMKQVVTAFAKKYAGTPEVVVYISSHGLAAGTQNFLAGVDTDLNPGDKLKALRTLWGDNENVYELEKAKLARQLFGERCCPLSVIVEALEGMSTDPEHCKIIILDACRTEIGDIGQFSKAPLLAGLGEGFAPVEPPSGMSFGFAAKAGQPSISNEDLSTTTPSLFTGVFAQRIQQPGSLDEIFRDVRNTVETASQQIAQRHPRARITKQSPFLTSDLRRSFAFVKGIVPRAKVVAGGTPQTATKDAPFINSLKMEFVPVAAAPGLLFSRWETRVADYEAFCRATGRGAHEKPDFPQGDDHPVVNVSFDNAQVFCTWLSERDGVRYRLPTDHEWSCAVGLGARENSAASPKSKDGGVKNVYPWGTTWPPPAGAGNFSSSLKPDSFENTSPAGKFKPSPDGLYDLSGNVWEWCDSFYEAGEEYRVLRGGSWYDIVSTSLLSSARNYDHPTSRYGGLGFRLVLEVGSGG